MVWLAMLLPVVATQQQDLESACNRVGTSGNHEERPNWETTSSPQSPMVTYDFL
jgi:hypothetical protein